MSTRMTLEEIRIAGLNALAEALGPVGMVRFLQQFETGNGDYSSERYKWLDRIDMETAIAEIRAREKESK